MSFDVVSFGETMFRLTVPEGRRLENTSSLQVHIAGTESNMLAGLARLNLKVVWLSALPDNPTGRNVARELRSHGVDTSSVVWTDAASRLGTFYVEESAEPLGIQVYYDRANSACALVDPESIDYALVNTARMLHLTGITPALGEHTRIVFQRLLERARAHKVPLSFDVNYRAKLWSAEMAAQQIEEACRQAAILFCSMLDATELWGFTGDAEAVLRQMEARFGTPGENKTLVLTLGSRGSAHLHNGSYGYEQAFSTQGRFRFGSGDAFDAGYLYAYLNELPSQEMQQEMDTEITALTFGNALAALKRCIPGDIATISLSDVHALLRRHEGQRFR
ncbi:MAG: bifunctional 2-dehydro-3-deoxygluconokinase/2-dehydro-3-deoxygalactonokinase [Ktedonobacteraceae bacterium]